MVSRNIVLIIMINMTIMIIIVIMQCIIIFDINII